MKKTIILAFLCVASLSANAQLFKKKTGDSNNQESRLVKQVDLYLQDKWGVGFTLRKETSPNLGWNLLGASYMSGWYKSECPDNFSVVNVRLMGIRCNIPISGNFKFYAEALPGYTYVYQRTRYVYMYLDWGSEPWYKTNTVKNHCFGLDCSAGFQVHKNISIGYNYTFLAPFSDSDNRHIHWARFSVMF